MDTPSSTRPEWDQPPLFCPLCGRPSGDLDDDGKAGRRHPRTSHDAAALTFESQRCRVLELLALGPATARAIAEALESSPNQIATRLLELREGGLAARVVDEAGEYVTAQTSRRAHGIVHEVTALGLVTLDRVRAA